MSLRQNEEMGLFTFYMQQSQLEKANACSRAVRKETEVKVGINSGGRKSSFHGERWGKNRNEGNQEGNVRKRQIQYKSEVITKRNNKLLSGPTTQPKQKYVAHDIKYSKSQSVLKYPHKCEPLSTPALLKANLNYLTSESNVGAKGNERMEETDSRNQRRVELCYKINKFLRNHNKPILRSIDLNHNMTDVVDELERRREESQSKNMKKKMKTRYSIKNNFSGSSIQVLRKDKKLQPLVSQMLRQSKFQRFKGELNQNRMIENKYKKGQSQQWKSPVRDSEQIFLGPVKIDRKITDFPAKIQNLNQQKQTTWTQIQKSSGGKSKYLEKQLIHQKPIILSKKSQILRSIFLHDSQR